MTRHEEAQEILFIYTRESAISRKRRFVLSFGIPPSPRLHFERRIERVYTFVKKKHIFKNITDLESSTMNIFYYILGSKNSTYIVYIFVNIVFTT